MNVFPMNFTLVKWAETSSAVLVHVYLDGKQTGTLAIPRAAFTLLEARLANAALYIAEEVPA